MISAEIAREIVEAHLAQMPGSTRDGDDSAVIVRVEEHRFGWEFAYQRAKWVETRDHSDMWIGTGPIVVDRRSGALEQLGSRQFGDMVAAYQRRYDEETTPQA